MNGWAAELITWLPMTMMGMWTMSWKNLRTCTIGRLARFEKRQKEYFKYRYGRKIWLTEFAMCCTHDVKEVEEFVRVLLESFKMKNYPLQIQNINIEFRASSHGWRQQTLSTVTLGSSQGKQKKSQGKKVQQSVHLQVQP